MVYAEMRQSRGRWYPPTVQAAGVLGVQAIDRGLMRWEGLLSRLDAMTGGEGPSESTVRRWAIADPSSPQRLVRSGVVSRGELPPWALAELDRGPGFARMQSPVAPDPATRKTEHNSSTEEGGNWGGLIGFGLLVLGVREFFGKPDVDSIGRIGRSRGHRKRLALRRMTVRD